MDEDRTVQASTPQPGIPGATSPYWLIDAVPHGNASRPRIVVDSAGNAYALWDQTVHGERRVWRNPYSPVSGWMRATVHDARGIGHAANIGISQANRLVTTWASWTDNGNGTVTRSIHSSRFE